MKKSRKDDIKNTAYQMIRESGYVNLSFAKISKDLGVTRENVHHYFTKKEDLGLACIDDGSEAFENYFQNLFTKDNSALEKLEDYFKIYKTEYEITEHCVVAQLLNEYTLLPTAMQDKMKRFCDVELLGMEQILQEGIQQNVFHLSEEVPLAAQRIILLLKGAVAYTKVYDNFQYITDSIINNLKK